MKKLYYWTICLFLLVSCGGDDAPGSSANGGSSSSNSQNLTEQVQSTVDNLKSLTSEIGTIVSSVANADGSTTCKDSKGNTINVDASGNTVIISATGDSTVIDNTIKESTAAVADEKSNSRWMGRAFLNVESVCNTTTESYCDYFFQKIKAAGAKYEETDVKKIIDNSYDSHSEMAFLKFNNTTCSITISDTLTHYDILTEMLYKSIEIPEQTLDVDEYYGIYLKPSKSEINIYRRVYVFGNDGQIDKTKYDDELIQTIPLSQEGCLLVYQSTNTLHNNKTQKVLPKKTEFFNVTRVSNTVIGIKNSKNQYRLSEGTNKGIPYFDVYEWGGTNKLYTLYYQL